LPNPTPSPTSIPPPPLVPAEDPLPPPEQETAILDVHPPHQSVHTWRDFFIHIGTITLGLFIALSLEGFIETIHHRRLVAEARENIRREIEENRQQLPLNLTSIQKDAARMKQNIVIIRQLRDHPRTAHAPIHFEVAWSGFQDAAWNTARDTGALNYMPFNEVQALSQLYTQQQYINTRGTSLFTDQGLAPRAIAAEDSVDDLRPAEIDDLLSNTTSLSAQIAALEELLQHLQPQYADAEKLER